ncbi:hypothetical protein A3Q56_02447 [Intoshia linei]|uniref:GATA-type domain-containing protein n=1 Tax=Intoshia linei TaxID=1819745 RepID=A0A177B677_9BILA|nr:hypothetical protein A3Q56_02447 [Intoshia linei]
MKFNYCYNCKKHINCRRIIKREGSKTRACNACGLYYKRTRKDRPSKLYMRRARCRYIYKNYDLYNGLCFVNKMMDNNQNMNIINNFEKDYENKICDKVMEKIMYNKKRSIDSNASYINPTEKSTNSYNFSSENTNQQYNTESEFIENKKNEFVQLNKTVFGTILIKYWDV